MDGWMDEWMDGWMDGWIDGKMERWINGGRTSTKSLTGRQTHTAI